MNKNIVYLSFLDADINKAKDVESGLNKNISDTSGLH